MGGDEHRYGDLKRRIREGKAVGKSICPRTLQTGYELMINTSGDYDFKTIVNLSTYQLMFDFFFRNMHINLFIIHITYAYTF